MTLQERQKREIERLCKLQSENYTRFISMYGPSDIDRAKFIYDTDKIASELNSVRSHPETYFKNIDEEE